MEEQSEHIADIEAESARKDLQIETLQNEIEHLSIQLNQSAIADIYNSQVRHNIQ